MFTSIWYDTGFDGRKLLLCMATALLLGVVIAVVFKRVSQGGGRTRRGTRQSGSNTSLLMMLSLLPVLVAVVILMVNGSIGTSVAVLGAFGLVRFRSEPGNAMEIGAIFFAMAVGLAVGMGYLSLAILLTGLVCVAMMVLTRQMTRTSTHLPMQLKITVPEQLNFYHVFDDLMAKYTEEYRMVRVKTANMGTMFEVTYVLTLKIPDEQKEFMDELRCRNGNLTIMMGEITPEKNSL